MKINYENFNIIVNFNKQDTFLEFTGANGEFLKYLESQYPNIEIVVKNLEIIFKTGNEYVFSEIRKLLDKTLYYFKNKDKFKDVNFKDLKDNSALDNLNIFSVYSGIKIFPKNDNQKKLLEAIEKNKITFAVGSAGTGKTYLAVAMAVKYLQEKKVEKIIITRPVVEAGESLGFLPGELEDKIDPYLRPIYDALSEFLGTSRMLRFIEKQIIEIAPLAYMRGRTLKNAFIILDEAQNTTTTQMKMFLTRFGQNSKAVITGDITQSDLKTKNNGLKQAITILKGIKGIEIIYFDAKDVIREKIVQEIINRYLEYEEK